ncbi:kelch domain-containing protein 10-like [Portunus trituberculatus]|uniref:kelch domain-containing protein 10-like n=1 Tax=Portunus trituberculatus TaxID=210409 RepID=UPI001E1CFE66|nr:kelch domain-containing protein 10-like [Portunus trituberculatus]
MDNTYMEHVHTWADEGSQPVGRSGHRIHCTDSFMYSVGGYNPNHGPLREVWRLNLSTGRWEQLSCPATTPETSISHSLASHHGDLLMTGGTSYPFGSILTSEVLACDQQTGEWRALHTSGPAPTPLYGQAVRRAGDYMYVVGGTSGFHFSLQAHALHLPSLTWTRLADNDAPNKNDEPLGRYRAEIGVAAGRVVVVGGASAFTIFPLDQLPVLNVNSGKWEVQWTKPDPVMQACPSPRRCHAAVQRDNELYVLGGTDGEEVFSDMWRLNLVSLAWTKLSLTLPTPLYFHDAALTKNGCIYVYGGLDSVGSEQRSEAVFRAQLEAPPLLEAAWGAFTSHCPNLLSTDHGYTNNDLVAAGVPRSMVKRLARLSKKTKDH